MPKPRKNKATKLKRTIKFLATCQNPNITKAILRESPDAVVKCICNAVLNAYKGDVQLSANEKKILSKSRQAINKLIDPHRPIKAKRKVLNQKGGFAFLPVLLSTVLGTLGSELFSSFLPKPKQDG